MAICYMTQEGYDKKMAELTHLETVERPAVVQAISEARDKGDLSENAEYDAAKERQGMLETKIAELRAMMASARIIDESNVSTDEVQLLTKVTIKNTKTRAKMTYTIVTETESNLREGKIAISTPIAKGLLGHKVGDVVEVTVPAGTMKFEILEISL
ncbi:MAG: transcription elongation factor GreA [Bacteroidales bacterium]|nr:transcription elongation factor GreA [Bacteroidales bacterium]MBQ7690958.1 transcription elongation factor GreA [Muribaculaceae bacterium]